MEKSVKQTRFIKKLLTKGFRRLDAGNESESRCAGMCSDCGAPIYFSSPISVCSRCADSHDIETPYSGE
jgi:hypothetical protein